MEDRQTAQPGGQGQESQKAKATPPQQQQQQQQQPAAPAEPAKPKENIKETIESIIIAFILAFVFRAFVVEAFVIPSGSMATTLLGAHMRFVCSDCGYQFDANYPSGDPESEASIPSTAGNVEPVPVHCPNCGLKLDAEIAKDPAVHYGDRILVLKYLYLIQPPRRWDVVVFKAPVIKQNEKSIGERYGDNYIKRLTGLPGEWLMILDGDVYTCPAEEARPEGGYESWPWKVQSKPRAAQEALWRVVYDNDYLPHRADWISPWQQIEGSGWNAKPARLLHFENASGEGTLNFNKDANPGTYPFTDWLPYDETMFPKSLTIPHYDAYGSSGDVPRWYVSDLKLQFSYQRHSGAGALRASLTKLDHTFTAEFDGKTARLWHAEPGGRRTQVGKDVALDFAGGAPLRVELTNVDYVVRLRVNDRDVIRTSTADYRPELQGAAGLFEMHRRSAEKVGRDESDLPAAFRKYIPSVQISAANQSCDLAHVSLWRDIYYTPYANAPAARALPERPVQLHRAGDVDEKGNVLDNEYFVQGDNSILSSDARFWDRSVELRADENLYADAGRVPERFMLGKAFFVYWPAGFRPFSRSAPGVVPNFGDMRFIH